MRVFLVLSSCKSAADKHVIYARDVSGYVARDVSRDVSGKSKPRRVQNHALIKTMCIFDFWILFYYQ